MVDVDGGEDSDDVGGIADIEEVHNSYANVTDGVAGYDDAKHGDVADGYYDTAGDGGNDDGYVKSTGSDSGCGDGYNADEDGYVDGDTHRRAFAIVEYAGVEEYADDDDTIAAMYWDAGCIDNGGADMLRVCMVTRAWVIRMVMVKTMRVTVMVSSLSLVLLTGLYCDEW